MGQIKIKSEVNEFYSLTSTYVEEFSEAAQVKYCKFKLKEF